MAVKKKVVELDTGNALKSIKDLRTELKSLLDLLLNLDKGTAEYNKTLEQAANIKHTLKELTEELAASAMDFGQIVGNVTNTIGGAVSGFQALSASMTLLGVENKDALESIKKLQALMAMTLGIAGVEKGIKSFNRLLSRIQNSAAVTKLFNSNVSVTGKATQSAATGTARLASAMTGDAAATKTATLATNTFKKALVSTGIGAIVVAVGLLITNLDKLTSLFNQSAKEAERAKKQMQDFNKAVSSANMNTAYYEGQLKKVQISYKPVLNSLKQHIELLKAQDKPQAQIAKAQQMYHDKYVEYLKQEQKAIDLTNNKLAETINSNNKLQGELGKPVNEKNVYTIMANYQQLIIKRNQEIADAEEKGNKNAKEKAESDVKRYENMVSLLQQYAANLEHNMDIEIDIANGQAELDNEKAKRKKQLAETLKALDNKLAVDSKKNQDKELEQIKQKEEADKKTLSEYREEGTLSETEYQKRLTQIQEIYQQQRVEINAKYEKKRLDDSAKVLSANSKTQLSFWKSVELQDKADYATANKELEIQFKNREISEQDYLLKSLELYELYNSQKQETLTETYLINKDSITNEIAILEQQLALNGLSDDQIEQIKQKKLQLNDLLLELETNYQTELTTLIVDAEAEREKTRQEQIQTTIDNLQASIDIAANAVGNITSIGDGLSQQWMQVFDNVQAGIAQVGESLKTGEKGWKMWAGVAASAINSAASILNALADEQDETTEEGFKRQKGLQIASATMNMLSGIVSVWPAAMELGPIAGPIVGAALSALITGIGVAQIVKIKQQQFDKNGGGTSASPSKAAMSSINTPVQYTQDVQGASIEESIKDTKVYVTEADITSTQKKVDVTESERSF